MDRESYQPLLPYNAKSPEEAWAKKRVDDALATLALLLPVTLTPDEVIRAPEVAKRLCLTRRLAERTLTIEAKLKRLRECRRVSQLNPSIEAEIRSCERKHSIYWATLVKLDLLKDEFDYQDLLQSVLGDHADEALDGNGLALLENALRMNDDLAVFNGFEGCDDEAFLTESLPEARPAGKAASRAVTLETICEEDRENACFVQPSVPGRARRQRSLSDAVPVISI